MPGTAERSICGTPLEARNTVAPTLQMEASILRASLLLGWFAPGSEDCVPLGYSVKLGQALGTISAIISWG